MSETNVNNMNNLSHKYEFIFIKIIYSLLFVNKIIHIIQICFRSVRRTKEKQ